MSLLLLLRPAAAPTTPWVNRTAVSAPRNGTTSHTVSFTAATAGNLLVAVATGAVTSTTPTGWTLPTNGAAVNNAGVYLWTKTATAGENSFSTTHNASNYPVGFVVYEFQAGSTFGSAAFATNQGNAAASPSLSGQTGTSFYLAVAGMATSSTTGSYTTTWSTGTADTNTFALASGTDGYTMATTYISGSAATTFAPAPTISNNGTGASVINHEGIVAKLTVVAPVLYPTFVSASNAVNASTGTSVSVPAPASIVAGNTLLAFVYAATSSTTVPFSISGWTMVGPLVTGVTFPSTTSAGGTQSSIGSYAIFSKTATGSEPSSYTVNGYGWLAANILQYSNTIGLDGSPKFVTQQNGNSVAPSLTTSTANDLIITFFGSWDGGTVNTPSGMTPRSTALSSSNTSNYIFEATGPSTASTATSTYTSFSGLGNQTYGTMLLSPGTTSAPVVQAAALSGSGTLTATSTPATTAAVALSGSGTTSQTNTPTLTTALAVSGSGTLTAATAVVATSTAALSGSGTLSATSSPTLTLTAPLSGAGTVSAAPTPITVLSPNLTGSGVLSASATPASTGVPASLSGSGTLSATGTDYRMTTSKALDGLGSLSQTNTPKLTAAATPQGVGTLSATSGTGFIASPILTGSGTLSATSSSVTVSAPTLTGSGTTSAAAMPLLSATAALSGVGSLSATTSLITVAAATLSGSGGLSATTEVVAPGVVTVEALLNGVGLLTATATSATTLNRTLAGSGTLSAYATLGFAIAANFGGSGVLKARLPGYITLHVDGYSTRSLTGIGQTRSITGIITTTRSISAVGRSRSITAEATVE